MLQLRRLDFPGRRHTTHKTTHHGESPWWWPLWCWFSPQRQNVAAVPLQTCTLVSWLTIVGGECRWWLDIGFIPWVQRKLQIRVHCKIFSARGVGKWDIFFSSGVMITMDVLSMTNSMLLFPMVYSDLAKNHYFDHLALLQY
jgi:hypothetical protein